MSTRNPCDRCCDATEESQLIDCEQCGMSLCKECNVDHKKRECKEVSELLKSDDVSELLWDATPQGRAELQEILWRDIKREEALIAEEEQRVNMAEYADWEF